MTEPDAPSDVAALTVQLLSAYLANNTVASDDLADLIRTTRAALTEEAAEPEAPEPETFTPAVSPRKSLAASSHIISLIDGKPYKTLKRHLAANGLTPESYRTRYNLPATYPMVAPDYAAHRRAVAQKIGLGSRKGAPANTDEKELPDLDLPTDMTEETETKPKTSSKRAAKSPKAEDTALKTETQVGNNAEDTASTSSQAGSAEMPAAPKRKSRTNKAKADASAGETPEQQQPETAAPKRIRKAAASDSEGGEPSAPRKSTAKSKPKRMARQPKTETSTDA